MRIGRNRLAIAQSNPAGDCGNRLEIQVAQIIRGTVLTDVHHGRRHRSAFGGQIPASTKGPILVRRQMRKRKPALIIRNRCRVPKPAIRSRRTLVEADFRIRHRASRLHQSSLQRRALGQRDLMQRLGITKQSLRHGTGAGPFLIDGIGLAIAQTSLRRSQRPPPCHPRPQKAFCHRPQNCRRHPKLKRNQRPVRARFLVHSASCP